MLYLRQLDLPPVERLTNQVSDVLASSISDVHWYKDSKIKFDHFVQFRVPQYDGSVILVHDVFLQNIIYITFYETPKKQR